jgi:hypothetical protein
MPASPKAKKTIAKDDKIKRPLSAYMFFSTENRDKVMKDFKFEKKQIGDIAKKLGEQWKKMSDKEKAPYEEKAKKAKAAYDAAKAKGGK